MKQKYRIVETYCKEIEVSGKSQKAIDKLVKSQISEICLGKMYERGAGIEFDKMALSDGELTDREIIWQIQEEVSVNRYQTMHAFQRNDLSREELFQYAEEMRLALEKIAKFVGAYIWDL